MWECRGTTCSTGGCTSVPTALDVMKLREKMNSGLSSSKSNFEKLLQIMREHRDKSANGGFRPVLIPTGYSGEGKVQVCMNAFGCLAGFTEGTYRRAKTEALISSHDSAMRMITSNALACPREHEKQAVSLVRAYINHVLVEQHEMQPVASLGSADGRQTAINKKTWAEKMKDMADYFRAQEVAPELIPEVSTAAFKKLWNECKQLVEKKLSTHSKCETCGDIASAEISLSHKNSQEGVTARRALKILKHEHQQKHLGQRNQMDIACLRSIVHARTIWVIMVDSATERNFALPRLGTRNASKKLANFPLWGFKLIAAYAPNFGFVPFLVHNSVKAGANLMLTVLWETLLAMRDKYGFLPDELHLQLDNTSAENKNVTVIAVAAWLVSSGKVRRVRLFYLMVGHTHIIIDQIFGVITKPLKKSELLVPRHLMDHIDTVLRSNPQYRAKPTRWLHNNLDWDGFKTEHLQPLAIKSITGHKSFYDEHGRFKGHHDLLFQLSQQAGSAAERTRMQYRVSTEAPYLPSNGDEGIKVIKNVPAHDILPQPAALKEKEQWSLSKKDGKRLIDTLHIALDHTREPYTDAQRLALREEWDALYARIPSQVLDLPAECLLFCAPLLRSVGPALLPVAENRTLQDENADVMALLNSSWSNKFRDRMQNPAVDLVVSESNPEHDVQAALEAFQLASLGTREPTTGSNSIVLPGTTQVVRMEPGGPLRLGQVGHLCSNLGPDDPSLEWNLWFFQHEAPANWSEIPAEQAMPLCGTFRMVAVETGAPDGKKHFESATVNRNHVVVFNARTVGRAKHRRLHVRSLRAIADSPRAHELNSLPDPLPAPFKHDSLNDDDSSEDEAEEQGTRRRRVAAKAAPRKKPAQAKAAPKRRKRVDSSSEEDDEEDEEEESEEEESEEEESSEEEAEQMDVEHALEGEKKGDEEEGEEEEGTEEEGEEEEEEEEVEEQDQTDGTTAKNCLAHSKYVLLDISEEPEAAGQTYKVMLAYVLSYDVQSDFGRVGWYDRTWTTKSWPTKGAKFQKFMPKKTTKKGPRTWAEQDFKDFSDFIVPVDLQFLGNNAKNTITLPAKFMKETVVPAIGKK